MNPLRLYYIARWLYEKKTPVIPKLIYYFQFFLFKAHIPFTAKIGSGCSIGYGGVGTVIHSRAVIGNNCMIGSGVTIGGTSKKWQVPVIGNNVYISTGAKIIGDIKVGNNVVIGANAVVIKDVADNTVVGGIPAKVLRTDINIKDYWL